MKQNTKRIFSFFLKHLLRHKGLALLMFLSMTIATLAEIAWPIFVRDFLNTMSESSGDKSMIANELMKNLAYILVNELINWGGYRGFEYTNVHLQCRIIADITNECFDYLQKHSFSFFNNSFAGGLVKKVSRLAKSFESITDKVMFDLYPMSLHLILTMAILYTVHPTLSLIVGVWAALFLAVNYWLSIYKMKFDLDRSQADTRVTAMLADTISNNLTVKLFAGFDYESRRFRKTTTTWFNKLKKSWNLTTHIDAVQGFLMIALEIILFYTAIKLWERDLLDVGDFFLIQAYLLEIFRQIWQFGRSVRDIYEALAEGDEMIEILHTDHEVKDSKNARELIVTSGKVEFDKVSFSYEAEGGEIFDKLSLDIKAGEKIAFVGESGGGKSTIIKLLLRLFDIQGGRILIDGQNIAEVTQDSLRSNVALVPQDPVLFHRSLMENIRYGRRDATDEEVLAAAKMAHCHEFIERFPNNYATHVGERGIKLSGGQRQRIAIARAILSNAKILVLDEATSSLDSESEKLIQDALQNLIRERTALIIAHRLSTVMNVDRIFVLGNGKVLEEGRHNQLINTENGIYKKLWDLQVGGFME